MNTYGDIIYARRRQLGITLVQLAKKIGSHKGYISGIENGKVKPPHPKISGRLARALDLDALDLVELGWAEKAPAMIRERVRKRLQQDNPLYLAQIVEPEVPKVDIVIPERKETA